MYGFAEFGLLGTVATFSEYFLDTDSEKYHTKISYKDPKNIVIAVNDIVNHTFVKYVIDVAAETTTKELTKSIFTYAPIGLEAVVGVIDIEDDYSDLVKAIYLSNIQDTEKVLKEADELKNDRYAFLLLTSLITVATAGTATLPMTLMLGSIGILGDRIFELRAANILGSGINGKFNWSVDPSGYVYEAAYSEWLPVPPPQLDVNIGLVSKASPKVISADFEDNTVIITFDKYIDPATIGKVVLMIRSGRPIDFSVDYSKNETSADGTVYAKQFIFTADCPIGIVEIPGTVLSYCGIPVEKTERINDYAPAEKVIKGKKLNRLRQEL